MAATFTLKLVLLECFQAQELNGDEIYIKLNDRVIWTWKTAHVRFSHDTSHPHTIDKLDFVQGRKHEASGWVSAGIDPEAFVFTDMNGGALLEVWDADSFTRDDLIGRAPVSASDGGHGAISVVMQGDGAYYRLTYEVTT
ncbi:MAG: hypothetical protein IT320_18040 [Anaerolineae bacterium]|nr:hypothetical protein [Anaerolineae bacterium]